MAAMKTTTAAAPHAEGQGVSDRRREFDAHPIPDSGEEVIDETLDAGDEPCGGASGVCGESGHEEEKRDKGEKTVCRKGRGHFEVIVAEE